MTTERQVIAVEHALQAAEYVPDDERGKSAEEFWPSDGLQGARGKQLADRLQDALPMLGDTIVCDGSNYQKLWVPNFAQALLQAALTAGAPGASALAGKFLLDQPVELFEVAALAGVSCASRYEVADGIFLMPFADLAYGPVQYDMATFSGASWITGNSEQPSAVLTMPFQQTLNSISSLAARRPTSLERRQRLLDAATALSLTGKCQPIVQAQWVQSADYLVNYVLRSARTLFSQDVRHWWGGAGEIDEADVSQARILLGISQRARDRILRSLTRLNQARLTTDVGDGLVDMMIALEILFGERAAGNKQDSLADKVADLLGESWEGSDVRSVVKMVYRRRNAVVHEGTAFSDEFSPGDVSELSDVAERMFGEAIQKHVAATANGGA